jgi:hypothetical protein
MSGAIKSGERVNSALLDCGNFRIRKTLDDDGGYNDAETGAVVVWITGTRRL